MDPASGNTTPLTPGFGAGTTGGQPDGSQAPPQATTNQEVSPTSGASTPTSAESHDSHALKGFNQKIEYSDIDTSMPAGNPGVRGGNIACENLGINSQHIYRNTIVTGGGDLGSLNKSARESASPVAEDAAHGLFGGLARLKVEPIPNKSSRQGS